jgi:hypothetical protein
MPRILPARYDIVAGCGHRAAGIAAAGLRSGLPPRIEEDLVMRGKTAFGKAWRAALALATVVAGNITGN